MKAARITMEYLFAATMAAIMAVRKQPGSGSDGRDSNERGDVPGWVMITMMTAIVVIVLLGVFQDAVVTAVKNAFDSISGQGGTPVAPGGTGTP